MFDIVIAIVAVAGLGTSLALAIRLRQLEERLSAALTSSRQGKGRSLPASADLPNPLQGQRIAIANTQDHAHPVFANLLKEQLLKEDVADAFILRPEELSSWSEKAAILISGRVVCNGYAEIYYEADFTCQTEKEPICTLIEKPPHGDRPGNLAIELVARLKTELEKSQGRQERRQAISELRD